MQSNAYMGTEFKYDQDGSTGEQYLERLFNIDGVRGIRGQLEQCPKSGRNHIQFYVELERSQRASWVRTHLSETCHWEVRRRAREAAIRYCEKEETRVEGPWVFGTWELRPGKRNDLEEIQEAIESGASPRTISREYFASWIRYHKSFDLYGLLHADPRDWEMDVQILYGEPGTGKTRRVYAEAAERNERVYTLLQNDNGVPWFDGYAGEEVLLIDDFYGWIKVSYMLKLMDRYPLKVQVKGSVVNFISRRIYITSNKPVCEWYDWDKIGDTIYRAFQRRITKTTMLWNPLAEN